MIADYLLISVGLIGLFIGSVTDIKKREVADWVNYFLIFSGLAIRLLYSISSGEWMFLLNGVIGFASMTVIAYTLFLTGQWGGGDSKMLMAMGALFATYPESLYSFFSPVFFGFPFLLSFGINLLMIGAVYGILWALAVGIFHFRDLAKAYRSWMSYDIVKQVRTISHLFALVLVVAGLLSGIDILRISGIVFASIIIFFFYLYVLIKAVEGSCMYRIITPDKLVEGDWPFDDVVVDGKKVFSKDKAIGFETKDIEMMERLYRQKKIGKIKVKHGVPFVPSFLFALIFTFVYGNVLAFLII